MDNNINNIKKKIKKLEKRSSKDVLRVKLVSAILLSTLTICFPYQIPLLGVLIPTFILLTSFFIINEINIKRKEKIIKLNDEIASICSDEDNKNIALNKVKEKQELLYKNNNLNSKDKKILGIKYGRK